MERIWCHNGSLSRPHWIMLIDPACFGMARMLHGSHSPFIFAHVVSTRSLPVLMRCDFSDQFITFCGICFIPLIKTPHLIDRYIRSAVFTLCCSSLALACFALSPQLCLCFESSVPQPKVPIHVSY